MTETPIPAHDAYDGLDLTENGLGQVRNFMDDWATSQQELSGDATIKAMTLVTGTLFAPVLQQHATEFERLSGVRAEVVPIANERLGETITVAGLLMGQDALNQLEGCALGDVVVFPRVMFDHPDGISLDDLSPGDIARALDRPVALADMMGDLVDIVQGKPALYFEPNGERIIRADAIQMDGGWAVEKYL